MWRTGCASLLFFLILELSPRPGVPQAAHLLKYCSDCKKILEEKQVTPTFYQNMIRNANYRTCPHNIVRFEAPRGVFCGNRIHPWVDQVTTCIDQGRKLPCQESTENQKDFSKGSNVKPPTATQESTTSNQKEFSKGSNVKPPTTTQESTTSTAQTAPSFRLSSKTWRGGTQKPSETTTEEPGTTQRAQETTIRLVTDAPDSYQNNSLLHGNKPSTEKDNDESKTKQKDIAIISLILIVLLMTAVGMYVWCQKRKPSVCRRNLAEESISYQKAPSQDPGGP